MIVNGGKIIYTIYSVKIYLSYTIYHEMEE